MSRYDYEMSKRIETEDYPFYALIMTAMRQADGRNLVMLTRGWPDIWGELDERYHAPGGYLEGERHEE